MTLHNWTRCTLFAYYFRGRKCIHYKYDRWIDLRTQASAAPLPESVQAIYDRQPGLHADRHHGGIF